MRPQIACTNCRYRKKKCNRAYPACSYCLQTHSRCTYVSVKHRVSPNSSVEIETPESQSVDGESGNCPWSDAFFLDAGLFRARARSTPNARLAPDARLRQELELDARNEQYLARYLEFFQSWISIIPPQEISTTLSAPPAALDGEDLLLLACVRLHAISLSDKDPRTKLYVVIKSSLASAEVHGTLTVKLLQAQVLVLLYEFGHGIYPGAYLTLGRCVDYLAALGIDEDAPDGRQGSTWIEAELYRRLWWAVFIMERCIAIAGLGRPLALSEPARTRLLPSDDESWAHGYPLPHDQANATLATPLKHGMGNFCLLVLVSHLLGQVIRIKPDLDASPAAHSETVQQLHRTITALENVIEEEAQVQIMLVSGARSLLNSIKMLLFSNPDLHPCDPTIAASADNPSTIAATHFLDRSRAFLARQPPDVSLASPFLLPWGYGALDHFYRAYARSGRVEDRRAIEDLEETFHCIERRWRLASVYTGLIYRRYVK